MHCGKTFTPPLVLRSPINVPVSKIYFLNI